MSEKSAIEWTDATWNPTTGCTKISPACANCYIERTPPFRIHGRKFVKGDIPMRLHPDRLEQPLRWRKPRRVFVNSLSDLFHADVPDDYIDRVFAIMALCPQHTFQVLTKRAYRMRKYFDHPIEGGGPCCIKDRLDDAAGEYGACHANIDAPGRWPLPNVWLGVSVENQHFADERIPLLLQTPAAVRFISAEPLLEAINLSHVPIWTRKGDDFRPAAGLDWVIVGGESGPRLRPTNPDSVRSIRDQCVSADVPFFFKQWGGKTAKSGGRTLDGRTWDELPDSARQQAVTDATPTNALDPVARIVESCPRAPASSSSEILTLGRPVPPPPPEAETHEKNEKTLTRVAPLRAGVGGQDLAQSGERASPPLPKGTNA